MKTVNARDLQKRIKECVDMSQQDKVVITRRGKPAAILVGVEGKDWADVALQTSSSFWKLIEAVAAPVPTALVVKRNQSSPSSSFSAESVVVAVGVPRLYAAPSESLTNSRQRT
jgi:prevent-host-death family protein